MRLAVVGSRNFDDYELMTNILDEINQFFPIDEIISGGAKGADLMSEQYANDRGIKTRIFLPDWKRYGRPAGMIRNKEIIDASTTVVAFWDGRSKGTENSISRARKSRKLRRIVLYEELQ